jgi:glyoxalase family protein
MKLEGIHHVTCITGDAPQNLAFYTGTLGLRLVKKTVNQDDPTVYHLFYADENGDAGSDLTFFEYPGARPGRAGAGMVHTILWRVGSSDALDFWAQRLGVERVADRVRFTDPEGLAHELVVDGSGDEPLIADHPEIPRELALQGFDGVRAYSHSPGDRSAQLLVETLNFEPLGDCRFEARGEQRGGWIAYDEAPADAGIPGGGTVHHVAWASTMDEHETWQRAVAEAGMRPTPVIDRFWFRSVYFREPSGVLFELATLGPGFTTDEPLEHLGEKLVLPPAFEHLRERIEPVLTPLPDPRENWVAQ